MELFEKLGVDWRLLVAQIVNFLILMGALFFILYKPLIAVLEKRRARIDESLKNAERISSELKHTTDEQSRILSVARNEAQRIVNEARNQVEQAREATVAQAREEALKIIHQSRQQIAHDREQLIREVRAEVAGLITRATEKVIGEKLTAERDRALVSQVLLKM